MRNFEDFLKEGVVKRQRKDFSRAKSLREEAERRQKFLKEMKEKIGITDENANYFIETAYDIIMELIRSRMLMDGFKAAGLSAHEAEISYLRNMGFSEPDIRFADELRYFRNGIVYYGKKLDSGYAEKVLAFLEKVYPKLVKMTGK